MYQGARRRCETFVKSISGVTGDDLCRAVGPVQRMMIVKRAETDHSV